jgi:aspartate/tyrosine/aromatic aminotransferase
MYFPNPTWPNHHNIARDCGWNFKGYRYFDPNTKGVDLNGMLEDLDKAPKGSVVVMHACAHNPTGCDLKMDEWKKVFDVVK